jgi:hypothetical protein
VIEEKVSFRHVVWERQLIADTGQDVLSYRAASSSSTIRGEGCLPLRSPTHLATYHSYLQRMIMSRRFTRIHSTLRARLRFK